MVPDRKGTQKKPQKSTHKPSTQAATSAPPPNSSARVIIEYARCRVWVRPPPLPMAPPQKKQGTTRPKARKREHPPGGTRDRGERRGEENPGTGNGASSLSAGGGVPAPPSSASSHCSHCYPSYPSAASRQAGKQTSGQQLGGGRTTRGEQGGWPQGERPRTKKKPGRPGLP